MCCETHFEDFVYDFLKECKTSLNNFLTDSVEIFGRGLSLCTLFLSDLDLFIKMGLISVM